MNRRLLLGAALVGAWSALWGDLGVGNLLGGVAVAAVVLVLLPTPAPSPWRHRVAPVALLRLAGAVTVALVVASARVALTVLRPTSQRLRSGVVTIPLLEASASPSSVATLANLISLTPGTLTLTATHTPPVLEVHVLGLTDPDDFRQSIARLEHLVVAALRPRFVDAHEVRG